MLPRLYVNLPGNPSTCCFSDGVRGSILVVREDVLTGSESLRDSYERIASLNAQSWETTQRSPEGALALAEEALELALRAERKEGVAAAELNAGWALVLLGRYDEAVGRLKRAREIYSALADADGVMKALNAFGVVSFRIGEHEQAQEFFEEQLRLAREAGSAQRELAALNNLGEVYAYSRAPSLAAEAFRDALALAEQIGDEAAQAVIRMNIGRVLLDKGSWEEALPVLQVALDGARAKRRAITEAEALTQLGRATIAREGGSDPDGAAEQLHLKSIRLYEEISHPSGLMAALEYFSDLLVQEGRLAEAERTLCRAVEIAHRTDSRVTSVDRLLKLALCHERAGDAEKALAVCKRVVEIEHGANGTGTARRIRMLRARHELESAQLEAKAARLQNSELREKTAALEVSNRKLQLMHGMGTELTSSLDLEEIASRLHDRINELMKADAFAIAFYNQADDALDFELVIEDGQRIPPFKLPVASDESFGGWVVRNRTPLILLDADREYRTYVTRRRHFTTKRCRSIVYLPLELEGRIIGVLTVQSHEKGMYDDDTVGVLRLLAPYVAVALENCRQLRTIKELNAELEDDKRQLQDAYQRIAHMANHDSLTQLPNRRLLGELIRSYVPLARRQGKFFGVLYLDLDDFKPVNDTFGHDVGDQVLVRVAELLCAAVRESDTVARIGGDEFVVIVKDVGSEEDVLAIAEKVLDATQTPFRVGQNAYALAASLGVSMFPADGESYDELVIAADRAMYRAKQLGKSMICVSGRGAYDARTSSRDESIESPLKVNRPST